MFIFPAFQLINFSSLLSRRDHFRHLGQSLSAVEALLAGFAEIYHALGNRVKRIILTGFNALSGNDAAAPLAHNDAADLHRLARENLNSQKFRI